MIWTPALDAELIRLREVEGFSYAEVARSLQLGRNQVLGRHRRLLYARKHGRPRPQSCNRDGKSYVANVLRVTFEPTGYTQRVTRHHPTLTGRLMGDPPPGRTPWA